MLMVNHNGLIRDVRVFADDPAVLRVVGEEFNIPPRFPCDGKVPFPDHPFLFLCKHKFPFECFNDMLKDFNDYKAIVKKEVQNCRAEQPMNRSGTPKMRKTKPDKPLESLIFSLFSVSPLYQFRGCDVSLNLWLHSRFLYNNLRITLTTLSSNALHQTY